MASAKVEMEGSDAGLKHLGFVRILAINAVVVVSNLYVYAKQNAGPLRSSVGKVENALAAVVYPVYQRFKAVPDDILVFLDNKVDEATNKLNECAPPAAKNAASRAQLMLKKTSHLAQDLVEEAKVSGPVAAVSHAGTISRDFAVNQLALIWYKANKYPALHSIVEMAVPTAAHWSGAYNKLVKGMAAKGCSLFAYIPLIPVEEMAKAYKQVEAGAAKEADGGGSSDSDKE